MRNKELIETVTKMTNKQAKRALLDLANMDIEEYPITLPDLVQLIIFISKEERK